MYHHQQPQPLLVHKMMLPAMMNPPPPLCIRRLASPVGHQIHRYSIVKPRLRYPYLMLLMRTNLRRRHRHRTHHRLRTYCTHRQYCLRYLAMVLIISVYRQYVRCLHRCHRQLSRRLCHGLSVQTVRYSRNIHYRVATTAMMSRRVYAVTVVMSKCRWVKLSQLILRLWSYARDNLHTWTLCWKFFILLSSLLLPWILFKGQRSLNILKKQKHQTYCESTVHG